MMEIELRVKANAHVEQNIVNIGAKLKKTSEQKDTYYKFSLDKERKLVLRIREKPGKKSILTFKGSSKDKEDIAWQEWENEIENPEALVKLMLSNGMVEVVKIDKMRKSFQLENIEINIDEIKGLGTFVEAEIISENIQTGRKHLEDLFFNKLGFSKDEIITEGYVPMMLRKNE